jgi:hypothetical protein
MFGAATTSGTAMLLGAHVYTWYHLFILLTCAILSFQEIEVYDWLEDLSWPKAVALIPLFLAALGTMFTQSSNPFLYFQF